MYSLKREQNFHNIETSRYITKVVCLEVDVSVDNRFARVKETRPVSQSGVSLLAGQQYCFRRENISQIFPVTSRKVSQPDLGSNFFTKPSSCWRINFTV